jgi:hypothetical protein
MKNSIDPIVPAQTRAITSFSEVTNEQVQTQPLYTDHLKSTVQESQIASSEEPGAGSALQEQIKEVMIPLLLKIFSLKQEAELAQNPPTRLHNAPTHSVELIRDELTQIATDLKMGEKWVRTCLSQVERAIREIDVGPT